MVVVAIITPGSRRVKTRGGGDCWALLLSLLLLLYCVRADGTEKLLREHMHGIVVVVVARLK